MGTDLRITGAESGIEYWDNRASWVLERLPPDTELGIPVAFSKTIQTEKTINVRFYVSEDLEYFTDYELKTKGNPKLAAAVAVALVPEEKYYSGWEIKEYGTRKRHILRLLRQIQKENLTFCYY